MTEKQCAYYSIGYDGSNKIYIGEPTRTKRVCRFCKKTFPDVKFNNTAHALSESIGTKYIINNEECDTCNELFSHLEQDFYNRHAFLLTCCNIKGKNGSRKIKSDNVDIFTKNGILTFAPHKNLDTSCKYDSNGVGTIDFTFLLKGYPHKPQNIYKCLVKYALSIMDTDYINKFEDTILWIKHNEMVIKQLPPVLCYSTNFHAHPRIAYFIRTTNNLQFPYAISTVEFANIGYFFIIPLGNKEQINQNMLMNFAGAFRKTFGNVHCEILDLSSTQTTYSKQHIEINNITAFIHPYPNI